MVLPDAVEQWSLTNLREKLIKIGAKIVRHARYVTFQMASGITDKLAVAGNISIMMLPPRSPELNPVENVWQFLRENWLSNRVFKSYEDIVAHSCHAWNNLTDQPWKIMSIGMRKWAHGF